MKSITFKVLASVLGTISIILIIITAASYYSLKNKQLEQFNQQVEDINKQLDVILTTPIFSYDIELIQKILDSYKSNLLIAKIIIQDQNE